MSTREKSKNARRMAILDAARQLIRDAKSNDFSMSELAAKAGVSLVTPYNLFGSKSDILLEIARTDVYQRAADITALSKKGLPFWVAGTARLLGRIFYTNRHFYRRLIITLVAQEHTANFRELLEVNYQLFEKPLQNLCDAGALPLGPPVNVLARHVSRSVIGSLQDCLNERGSEELLSGELEVGLSLLLMGCAGPADRKALLKQITPMPAVQGQGLSKSDGPVN